MYKDRRCERLTQKRLTVIINWVVFRLFPMPACGLGLAHGEALPGTRGLRAWHSALANRERNKRYMRLRRERLKQNPLLYSMYREKQRQYDRRYREKIKQSHHKRRNL